MICWLLQAAYYRLASQYQITHNNEFPSQCPDKKSIKRILSTKDLTKGCQAPNPRREASLLRPGELAQITYSPRFVVFCYYPEILTVHFTPPFVKYLLAIYFTRSSSASGVPTCKQSRGMSTVLIRSLFFNFYFSSNLCGQPSRAMYFR